MPVQFTLGHGSITLHFFATISGGINVLDHIHLGDANRVVRGDGFAESPCRSLATRGSASVFCPGSGGCSRDGRMRVGHDAGGFSRADDNGNEVVPSAHFFPLCGAGGFCSPLLWQPTTVVGAGGGCNPVRLPRSQFSLSVIPVLSGNYRNPTGAVFG